MLTVHCKFAGDELIYACTLYASKLQCVDD